MTEKDMIGFSIKGKAFHLLISLLLLWGSSYGLNPSPTYYYTPDSLHLRYLPVSLHSGKYTLNAWQILPARVSVDKKCTIIVANGDAGNMGSNLLIAKCLSDIGYTVFLFDYRGFGTSTPFPIDKRMLYYNEYSDDLDQAILWSRQNSGNRVGLLGLSMGSLICLESMQSVPVDFFIAESLMYDPEYIAAFIKMVKNDVITLPPGAKSYEAYLVGSTLPIGIIAGRKDRLSHYKDMLRLGQKNKHISVVLHRGDHLEGIKYLSKKTIGDVYAAKINSILSAK
jgi:alpha/beta superfamily hydrolase